MEYGEFNSINTSLVEYERTTKKVPTMKPTDLEKKKADEQKARPNLPPRLLLLHL